MEGDAVDELREQVLHREVRDVVAQGCYVLTRLAGGERSGGWVAYRPMADDLLRAIEVAGYRVIERGTDGQHYRNNPLPDDEYDVDDDLLDQVLDVIAGFDPAWTDAERRTFGRARIGRVIGDWLRAYDDETTHDCDREYRHDCARCNGVSPGDVGTW